MLFDLMPTLIYMDILFCDNPLDSRTVDPDFSDEFAAAEKIGLATHLFSFEDLTRGMNAVSALRRITRAESLKTIIYRGWMLKPSQYSLLYELLLEKNYSLINSATEYQNCHYLPDSYKFIKEYTPKTVWLTFENQQIDYNRILDSIAAFGDSPLIVKDFVKSQKHYWDTACFIPSATDRVRAGAVIRKFVDLQGPDLNEGLVFREFVLLNDLATHSKSGMPLKQEYRLFFLNRRLLGCFDYWEEGQYILEEQPPLDLFASIAQHVQSNFFSLDVAKTQKGDWIIIELGDGQVAGLPDKADRLQFYDLIKQIDRC
jgi:hypothetical protein